MKLINPLQMTEWGIKEFLAVTVGGLLVYLGLLGADTVGIGVPVLRQAAGLLYFNFIPGVLIIRILRMHGMNSTKTLVYSVGLSVGFLMLLGLLLNTAYPWLGIFEPLSTLPMVTTVTAVIIVLSILCYLRDHAFPNQGFTYLSIDALSAKVCLLLVMLPLLSICGASLVNFDNSNFLLLILVASISVIPVLVAFDKAIPKAMYPLVIFMISLALLYQRTLISNYLTGSDIQLEFIVYRLSLDNFYWNPLANLSAYNSVISCTILPVAYTSLLSIDGVSLFKLVWPLLFSMVPIALYQVYRQQVDHRIAFLSVFFFMSLFTYFTEMTYLGKQAIAEIFFALSILLLLDYQIKPHVREILVILFGALLVLSHYSLSYLYMFALIFGALILTVTKHNPLSKRLTWGAAVLFTIIALSWFMYVSQSISFNIFFDFLNNSIGSISGELLSPQTTDLRILTVMGLSGTSSLNRLIILDLSRLTYVFIFIGFFFILLAGKGSSIRRFTNYVKFRKKTNPVKPEIKTAAKVSFTKKYLFDHQYMVMAFAFLILLLVTIVWPISPYTSGLGIGRMYHISLFFLAPFCIIGGIYFFSGLKKGIALLSHQLVNETKHDAQED
jgi:uncharacterized membrane protein